MQRFAFNARSCTLLLLISVAPQILAQTLTLTGHVVRVEVLKKPAFCGCSVGESVTATIGLRTYYIGRAFGGSQGIAMFPLTALPLKNNLGLPETEFLGNTFSLQIGNNAWVNQFFTSHSQDAKYSGALQLTNAGGPSNTFNQLFTTAFALRRRDKLQSTDAEHSEVLSINLDTRKLPFWNTTGDPIPSYAPGGPEKTMVLSYGGTSFNLVVIQIDQLSADPTSTSQVDAKVTRLQQQLAKQIPPGPVGPLPPGGPHAGGSMAVFAANPFPVCSTILKASTGIMSNLLPVYEDAAFGRMALETFELEVNAWRIMAGLTAACSTEAIISAVSAMASNTKNSGSSGQQGNGNGPLKSIGGKPTVPSAILKLQQLGAKFGRTPDQIAELTQQTGLSYKDTANQNNINIFAARPDGASGYIRVTLDPSGSRIISAGLNQASDVANGIASGRFIPF